MRKLMIAILAVALLTPAVGGVMAQEDTGGTWTELSATFVTNPYVGDAGLTIDPVLSVFNYIDNKGVGFFFGRDRGTDSSQVGPMFAWRVVPPHPVPLLSKLGFLKGLTWAHFIYTQSNWGDGNATNDLRWGMGQRFSTGVNGLDVDLRQMFDSRDETRTTIKVAAAIVFYP